MLQFSDLTIETAIANRSEAMEFRDHFKNGASSKSQMSRGNFFLIIISLMTIIMFSMVACGGSGSRSSSDSGSGNKIPDGTYFVEGNGPRSFLIFSGNEFLNNLGFKGWIGAGTYEIVTTDMGEQRIVFTLRDASVRNYSYSRSENRIRIDGTLFIKDFNPFF